MGGGVNDYMAVTKVSFNNDFTTKMIRRYAEYLAWDGVGNYSAPWSKSFVFHIHIGGVKKDLALR